MTKSFSITRPFVIGYAVISLLLTIFIGANALSKSLPFFALALVFFAATVAISIWKNYEAVPFIAALAFLSGWMETTFSGYNLDISAGILCLGVGAAILSMKHKRKVSLHPSAAALLLFALFTAVSFTFVYFRIISFSPVEGFPYLNYAVNIFGLPSDNAILNVLNRTANHYSWFGLLFLALKYPFKRNRRIFGITVVCVIAANFIALLLQQNLGDFLIPTGQQPNLRLNGLTSFSYALGASMEILFLLASVWFFSKRSSIIVSISAVLMILYAIYVSGSRTALLVSTLAATGWLFILLYKRALWNRSTKACIIIGIVALLLIGSYVVFNNIPADHTTAIGRLARDLRAKGLLEAAYAGRSEQYPLILTAVSDYPATGFGVGTFHYQISNYQELNGLKLTRTEMYVMQSNAPNLYLGIASELGIPAVLLFLFAVVRVALERSRDPKSYSLRSYFLLFGLFAYSVGLIVGPQLYNAEAASWFWILCGAVVWSRTDDTANAQLNDRKYPAWMGTSILVVTGILYIALSLPVQSSLDHNRQWERLRWHLNMGFFPAEESGQWSGPRAAMLLEKGRFARVTWHTGAESVDYEGDVRFYLDGTEVMHQHAGGGKIKTTLLVIPTGPDHKELFSVSVEPPFIPAEFAGGDDRRRLGAFLHSVEILEQLDDWIGFYPEEVGKFGRQFRWCGMSGYVPLPEANAWRFYVRSLKIPADRIAVQFKVVVNGTTLRSIELSDRWKEVILDRDEIRKVLGKGDTGQIVVQVEADRAYSPSDIFGLDDDRGLAFAITQPEPLKR